MATIGLMCCLDIKPSKHVAIFDKKEDHSIVERWFWNTKGGLPCEDRLGGRQ